MIDPAVTPGAIKTGMLALKMAVQQERDVAAVALREAAKTPAFDGKGSSDPHVGNVLDINV
jgi:hypothetical protein